MTMTKKKKTIFFLVIPAALVLVAVGVVLWLVLRQGAPQVLEPQYNPVTGELLHYTIVQGVSSEEAEQLGPPPMASFTPPEGWTQIRNAAEYADQFSTGYEDLYRSAENQVTTLGFSQQYAMQGTELVGGQEVQFGDRQVIYTQRINENPDLGYSTQVNWVEGEWLFTITCLNGPPLDVNQMLDLVSRVDTQTLRQPIHSPLTLVRGSSNTILVGENTPFTVTTYTRSEGNPQIPENPQFPCFSQPPPGYQASRSNEQTNLSDDPEVRSWIYSNPENSLDLIELSCCLGGNTVSRRGTEWGGFSGGIAVATDPGAIRDAVVNGNPAFVYQNGEQSEIAWVDGYCSLFISCYPAKTDEEMVALAEMVEVPRG